MHHSCPKCGGRVNAHVRGSGDWSPLPPDREHRRSTYHYRCINSACGKRTLRPDLRYDDRLEWFFAEVVWRIGCGLGIAIGIAFLLQILGIW